MCACVCVLCVLFRCVLTHCVLLVVLVQHKKLSVEGGGMTKDFRKGQKQGDLEIWDPVDQVLTEGSDGACIKTSSTAL